MKKVLLLAMSGLLFFSCKKETGIEESLRIEDRNVASLKAENSKGAIQVSGVGVYAEAAECDAGNMEVAYVIKLTGDLQGCLFVFVDEYRCSASGAYREIGREYFVGTYNGMSGTFWTDYRFESKFEGCTADGAAMGAEIFGRCQHPIHPGSGTGVFEGATGRLDFKDDIAAGNFPYRGHIKF